MRNNQVVNGVPEYKGMIDCLAVTVKREGVLSLWSGWTPYFARTAPLTVITLMLMDVCLYQYKNMA